LAGFVWGHSWGGWLGGGGGGGGVEPGAGFDIMNVGESGGGEGVIGTGARGGVEYGERRFRALAARESQQEVSLRPSGELRVGEGVEEMYCPIQCPTFRTSRTESENKGKPAKYNIT
jgi:hypothetical protein